MALQWGGPPLINYNRIFSVLQLSSAHVKQLIHSGDIDKLEQAVLEGQGKKLVGEYSADYKTRTFLKSIPALMVGITDNFL